MMTRRQRCEPFRDASDEALDHLRFHHDMNNVLSTILGNAELILQGDLRDEALLEGVERIYIASLRAHALVETLRHERNHEK